MTMYIYIYFFIYMCIFIFHVDMAMDYDICRCEGRSQLLLSETVPWEEILTSTVGLADGASILLECLRLILSLPRLFLLAASDRSAASKYGEVALPYAYM